MFFFYVDAGGGGGRSEGGRQVRMQFRRVYRLGEQNTDHQVRLPQTDSAVAETAHSRGGAVPIARVHRAQSDRSQAAGGHQNVVHVLRVVGGGHVFQQEFNSHVQLVTASENLIYTYLTKKNVTALYDICIVIMVVPIYLNHCIENILHVSCIKRI